MAKYYVFAQSNGINKFGYYLACSNSDAMDKFLKKNPTYKREEIKFVRRVNNGNI